MLLIKGGTVVGAAGVRRSDVLVEGGRIAAVGGDLVQGGAELLDASGALVIPGGIDVHTHFDLPVGAVRSADDFESGTLAAACGGTTCVVDFAGAGREPPEEALGEWHAKAHRRAVVDYGFHVTVTSLPEDPDGVRSCLSRLLERGVASVKLYMAYPERLMVDDATLARALAASADTGALVCVHAEDGREVVRRTEEQVRAGNVAPSAIPLARPPEIEADAIRRVADLARQSGAPVYVVHLSSAAGLAEVRMARERGSLVLAETCPQYLFLSRDRLPLEPAEAANFVCTPPVRERSDSEALLKGLADGSVQTVATDHCPFTIADRSAGTAGRTEGWPDFREIPGGLPGVETRLSLVYQEVVAGRLSLERWVGLVATEPARLFGLRHVKGSVEPGLDADLVVFDPGAAKTLDASSLHMRTDHSPYEGMTVRGWPALTLSRGRVVSSGGAPADVSPGWGRFVPRRPFGWRG